MCIYIAKMQVFTTIQPNGSILYKKYLIQHAYTKMFSYTICCKKKSTHQELQKKYKHTGKAPRTTQPEEGKKRE